MIPAEFDYVRATSVDDAGARLREYGEDAKLLAGGHSLIPLMRLRFAAPTALVDIGGLVDLAYVRRDGDRLRIGALTTHRAVHEDPLVQQLLPLLSVAARRIGDVQVRNRGTMGGVVAHADPAAEYAALCLMLDAEIVTTTRTIAAKDFFQSRYTTPLEHDELVLEIVLPVTTGPSAYVKFAHGLFDWAILGVLVQQLGAGWRIGLTSLAETPVRARAVEEALADGASIDEASRLASQGLDPAPSARASTDYKLHLARVLTAQALRQAQTA